MVRLPRHVCRMIIRSARVRTARRTLRSGPITNRSCSDGHARSVRWLFFLTILRGNLWRV